MKFADFLRNNKEKMNNKEYKKNVEFLLNEIFEGNDDFITNIPSTLKKKLLSANNEGKSSLPLDSYYEVNDDMFKKIFYKNKYNQSIADAIEYLAQYDPNAKIDIDSKKSFELRVYVKNFLYKNRSINARFIYTKLSFSDIVLFCHLEENVDDAFIKNLQNEGFEVKDGYIYW